MVIYICQVFLDKTFFLLYHSPHSTYVIMKKLIEAAQNAARTADLEAEFTRLGASNVQMIVDILIYASDHPARVASENIVAITYGFMGFLNPAHGVEVAVPETQDTLPPGTTSIVVACEMTKLCVPHLYVRAKNKDPKQNHTYVIDPTMPGKIEYDHAGKARILSYEGMNDVVTHNFLTELLTCAYSQLHQDPIGKAS